MDCRSNKSLYIKINALSQTHVRSNKMVGHPYSASNLLSDSLANLSLTCVRNKAVNAKRNSVGVPATWLPPLWGRVGERVKRGRYRQYFRCRPNALSLALSQSRTHIRPNQMVGYPYPTAHFLFRRPFQPTTAPISPHTPPTASEYRPAARFR